MSRRLCVTALFAGLCLLVPRTTQASILDFIWDLSGPQLIGVGVSCRWDFNRNVDVCDFARPGTGESKSVGGRSRLLFSTAATAFVSTGKNSEQVDYRFGDAYAITLDPGVSVRSYTRDSGLRVYHSVGLTYDLFFGSNFQTFDKVGVKVTPVEVLFDDRRFSLAATVRLYPNGFTKDEFGIGPRLDYNRPFEAVYGVTFGYWFTSR